MNIVELQAASAPPRGGFQLRQIDLTLGAGEVLGVVGPNGAGKSSLLQLLAGDAPLHSGTRTLLGAALEDWAPLPRARCLAVLPQFSLLNFPFTVEEVVLLGRSPHRSGHREDAQVLHDALRATDALHLRARTYTQLSGGERQRVQLARVFAQVWRDEGSPRLLLLDEPTAALDLAHQRLVLDSLRALAATGCGVVVTAHDCNWVAALAQQLVVLSGGQLVARGSPGQVLTPGLFADVFGVRVHIAPHPEGGHPLVVPL